MPPRSRTFYPAAWLLDLDVWGQVLRFTSGPEPTTVTDANGNVRVYQPGLTPMTSATESQTEYGIEVVTAAVDWAKLRARGTPITGTVGTLRLWFEGQPLEEADVIVVARAAEVEFGALGEPLVFTLSRVVESPDGSLVDPKAVVSSETWPSSASFELPDGSDGAFYPIPIGKPIATSGSPGILADYSIARTILPGKLVIADRPVAATTVRIYDLSAELFSYTHDVFTMTDVLGRTVSYVKIGANVSDSSIRLYEDHEYAVAWEDSEGGIKYRSTDAAGMRGLGLVLMWAAQQQTQVPIDLGAMEAQRGLLDVFKVDTYICSPIAPLEWIEKTLETVFPIRRRWGQSGLYWERIRPITRVDCTAVLDVDKAQVSRVGGIRSRWSDKGLANRITIRYAPSLLADRYALQVTFDAELDAADSTVLPSAMCAASQHLHGVVAATVDADAIADSETAKLVGQALVRERAFEIESVAYSGGPELARFKKFEAVAITDSALYLDERPARLVDRQVLDGGGLKLLFELEPDPPRRTS
jgi:hypothetical protein